VGEYWPEHKVSSYARESYIINRSIFTNIYDITLTSITKNLVLRPIFTNIYDITLTSITKNLVLRPIFTHIYDITLSVILERVISYMLVNIGLSTRFLDILVRVIS
jgi:hypothetical protein